MNVVSSFPIVQTISQEKMKSWLLILTENILGPTGLKDDLLKLAF